MWIMVSGPYRSGAATAEARARNLAEMNRVALALFRAGHSRGPDDEAALFRASRRPTYTALDEVPAAR